MSYRIEEIEGIGPSFGQKLGVAGVARTTDLLKRCGSAKGRKEISAATGIDTSRLLKWANLADLMRVKGVGRQFSELLEAAGVDTVKELKQRNAENLAARMKEVNAAKRLSRSVPSSGQVGDWVEQAKSLRAVISH